MPSSAYVFPQQVTRIYEKQVVKAVHIRDKGGPNEHEEVEVENVGWMIVVGTIGYLVPDKPVFSVGQDVEVVIRPVVEEKADANT
jgi:hypothetical protein